MSKLIEHLKSFNRKERFILLREVLGPQTFQLDKCFREKLEGKIGSIVPDDAFVAMDYHLDWLQIAMWFRKKDEMPQDKKIPMCCRNESMLIEGTQEDIDLLIAFDDPEKTDIVHLVLVEAKGDTPWKNDQLNSKARRLSRIFGSETVPKDVTPYFVMMSPSEPKKIRVDTWPCWMKRSHLELPLPERLLKFTRSDECGENSKNGGKRKVYRNFMIKKVKKSG